VQPEKEIEKRLVKLKIEAKEIRIDTTRNIGIVVLLIILFFVLAHNYPQCGVFLVIDLLIILIGGVIGIGLFGLSSLVYPLRKEYRAFQKIADAAQILKKSADPTTYREALRDVTSAHNILYDMESAKGIEWYKETNEILDKFLKNLEKIVLPAIRDSVIIPEHLEEIALAVYSLDPKQIDVVNKTLESESSYNLLSVKVSLGASISGFMQTHNTLKNGLIFLSCAVGCGIFYYLAINYWGIPKEYSFSTSVGLFIGLLGIYFMRPTRRPRPKPRRKVLF